MPQYLGIDQWNSNPVITKQKTTPRPVLIHLLQGQKKKRKKATPNKLKLHEVQFQMMKILLQFIFAHVK